MTTTPTPDAPPSTSMSDEEYAHLSSHVGRNVRALITDQRGRVLIQRVDHPTTCLLQGGAVDENESPAQGRAGTA
ncbi:hypothetical protein ACFQ60_03640 [Streptomyces zhihengii]